MRFSPVSHRKSGPLAWVFCLLACGCAGHKPAAAQPAPQARENAGFAKLSGQASDVFGASKASAALPDSSWTIVIVSAVGEGMEGEAQLALDKIRSKGGLPQAYMERRGKSMVVA